jgi:hypothetical protein
MLLVRVQLGERGLDKIQHGFGATITETLKEQDKNVTILKIVKTGRHSLKENPSPPSRLHIRLDGEAAYKLVKDEDAGA